LVAWHAPLDFVLEIFPCPPPLLSFVSKPQTPKVTLPLNFDHICRNILADKPRVSRFPTDWS
jgi:hypothetical protein